MSKKRNRSDDLPQADFSCTLYIPESMKSSLTEEELAQVVETEMNTSGAWNADANDHLENSAILSQQDHVTLPEEASVWTKRRRITTTDSHSSFPTFPTLQEGTLDHPSTFLSSGEQTIPVSQIIPFIEVGTLFFNFFYVFGLNLLFFFFT